MNPRLDYTNTSRLIHLGPVDLLSVTVAGDGADGDCQIYDGEDTNGRLVAHIETLTGLTAHIVYPENGRLDYGLYVVVNAATTKVTIQHSPREK
jgi:hypothetical protein